MSELTLRLADDIRIAVPADLSAITTYVLLEQEAWFEKEPALLRRWLRPGMAAIDIGANLGVYSLMIAQRVGPAGRVVAYEPAGEPRRLLERSRDLNGLANLEIVPTALSDRPGSGRLSRGASSELGALGGAGAGEDVPITTLDAEDERAHWSSPDFVKIDAEGEEERILAGGARFFARHSPLVMFEIKQERGVNRGLIEAFQHKGYRVFRQVGEAPLLVPYAAGEALDPSELNLFAAKPDRAAALASAGLLISALPEWRPDGEAWPRGRKLLRAQAFAAAFPAIHEAAAADGDHRLALAGYAVWRTEHLPPETRAAALFAAYRAARSACAARFSFARASTLGRIAGEAGERAAAVQALDAFLARAAGSQLVIAEPFWPAAPRYDAIDPGPNGGTWLIAAAAEQRERARAYSSYFAPSDWVLDWLCRQPFAATEMERRRILQGCRAGRQPLVPPRLAAPAADHLNAELWRTGRVPGTRLG